MHGPRIPPGYGLELFGFSCYNAVSYEFTKQQCHALFNMEIMMKNTILVIVMTLLTVASAAAQIVIKADSGAPLQGKSPNAVSIDLSATGDFRTVNSAAIQNSLSELTNAVMVADDIVVGEETLKAYSCSFNPVSLPREIRLELTDKTSNVELIASGSAEISGKACYYNGKRCKCPKKYLKTFPINGNLSAVLSSLPQEDLITNFTRITDVTRQYNAYRLHLGQSLRACSDGLASKNQNVNVNNSQVSNNPINQNPERKIEVDCTKPSILGTIGGALLGGFTGSRTATNNRKAGAVGGATTGGLAGFFVSRTVCKKGGGTLLSVGAGTGAGGGAGALTGYFFRKNNNGGLPCTTVDRRGCGGNNNVTGPQRVCNGVPCSDPVNGQGNRIGNTPETDQAENNLGSNVNVNYGYGNGNSNGSRVSGSNTGVTYNSGSGYGYGGRGNGVIINRSNQSTQTTNNTSSGTGPNRSPTGVTINY